MSNDATYKGIAPDATLYATSTSPPDGRDIRENMEWLVSCGVDVINMSAGQNTNGVRGYASLEKWIDHIAFQHYVNFVSAIGNSGEYDNTVKIPALAYNTITVGNLDIKETVVPGDDVRGDTSCYVEAPGYAEKPDIMAPGDGTRTAAGDFYQTSAAAPHVAGVIAQLCQREPRLCIYPEAVKAILMASIDHRKHSYESNSSEYDEYGAGVINANLALNTVNNENYITATFDSNSPTTHTYTVNVTGYSMPLRVAFAGLKVSEITGDHTELGNYPSDANLPTIDIFIYDSNNQLVESYSSSLNVAVIEVEQALSSQYRIEVVKASGATSMDYSIAWYN